MVSAKLCEPKPPEEDTCTRAPRNRSGQMTPGFSLGGRSEGPPAPAMPGPGSYLDGVEHLAKYRRAPKCSFGSATRLELETKRVPGPGEYDAKTSMATERGFSCTPRRDCAKVLAAAQTIYGACAKSPGPGAHKLPGLIGNGPKHSFAPRPTERSSRGPGPGDYECQAMRGPRCGFGSGPRLGQHFIGTHTPGPGSYRHDASQTGPKVSMGGRSIK
mmetsp:Transcript_58784/g.156420  ORF Transcript_58784/g.156420 Transcript_58784/m.156420 type:complete len:216 (-) Transcript_58784:125-772(-)